MRVPLGVVCGLVGATISASAVQPTLDRRGIEEAIVIGQSRFDAERARFHTPYRLRVSKPPVDWIDVITPFHRVALAAEARARIGDRVFGQREAAAVLAVAPDAIELLIELTFHPMNTYVGVPAYNVYLVRGVEQPITSQYINRYPRFGPRTEGAAPALPDPNAAPILGKGQPMQGGTIVVRFSVAALDTNGRYDIVIIDGPKELVRTAVDLGRIR